MEGTDGTIGAGGAGVGCGWSMPGGGVGWDVGEGAGGVCDGVGGVTRTQEVRKNEEARRKKEEVRQAKKRNTELPECRLEVTAGRSAPPDAEAPPLSRWGAHGCAVWGVAGSCTSGREKLGEEGVMGG